MFAGTGETESVDFEEQELQEIFTVWQNSIVDMWQDTLYMVLVMLRSKRQGRFAGLQPSNFRF